MARLRTCVGCRRALDPATLVRVTATGDGSLVTAATGGRGAWLCAGSLACFERAARSGAFARALRRPVSAEAVGRLADTLWPRPGSEPRTTGERAAGSVRAPEN